MKADKCEACGKTGKMVELEDTDHQTVAVLCKGRGYNEAKPDCLRKRLEQKPKCLVCGTDERMYFSGARLRPICAACESVLAQVRADQGERKCYSIRVFNTFGAPLPRNAHIDYDTVSHAFQQMLCGENRETFVPESEPLFEMKNSYDTLSTGDIWVRLTPVQAEGARAFVTAFHKYVADVSEACRKDGHALLVRLARGEVSIDEFNDGQNPARKS